MALKRAHRLSLRFKRESLIKSGQSFVGNYFTVISSPSLDQLQIPRAAVIVSKKTAALAANRNKIKRIILSLVQEKLPSLPAHDYLIIPKRQVLQTATPLLREELFRLLK